MRPIKPHPAKLAALFLILTATAMLTTNHAYAESKKAAEAQDDHHAGYYYPAPQTHESYSSVASVMQGISKKSRIGFVVGITELQLKRSYAPSFVMFAKGDEADKLIIVAIDNTRYQTLFQLRALMALASAQARTSPLFAKTGAPEDLNFLDLCHIAGFKQITITNGNDISHQITLQ